MVYEPLEACNPSYILFAIKIALYDPFRKPDYLFNQFSTLLHLFALLIFVYVGNTIQIKRIRHCQHMQLTPLPFLLIRNIQQLGLRCYGF